MKQLMSLCQASLSVQPRGWQRMSVPTYPQSVSSVISESVSLSVSAVNENMYVEVSNTSESVRKR